MGKGALGLGQGGVAGEGLLRRRGDAGHPLAVAFERLGIDPDLADYFFRLHREIEPFEQDEGWEYVPEPCGTARSAAPSSAPTSRRSSPSGARTRGCCGRMKRLSGMV